MKYSSTDPVSAKNIVLAGVKSVTIYDPEPATVQDLSTQVSFENHASPAISYLSFSSFSVRTTLENPVGKQLSGDLPNSTHTFLSGILQVSLEWRFLLI